MTPGQRKHKLAFMSLLCGVAAFYCLFSFGWLANVNPWLNGAVGILLGLFIASIPSANLLDMLLYSRFMTWATPGKAQILWWITYNTMVLVIGGLVLTVGAMQFNLPPG